MQIKTYFLLFLRVLRERPFYLWKYIHETVRIALNSNILRWRRFIYPNVIIGSHPRILSLNAFKAEKPNASIQVGDQVVVYYGCDILVTGSGRIVIGNGCSFGSNFRMYCKESISIGDSVLISWNVLIMDYDAHAVDPDLRYKERMYLHKQPMSPSARNASIKTTEEYSASYVSKPVVIGDNVWIGTNSIILKGVHIGQGSVVAAGAVVTSNVPECSIVAGNPARVVREIN